MAATNTQIEDELKCWRSRSILLQVINELDMHTNYRIKRKDSRIYGDHHPSISVTLEKAAMDTSTGGTADGNRKWAIIMKRGVPCMTFA